MFFGFFFCVIKPNTMKKIIFYPFILSMLLVTFLSSCNKKQLVQKTYKDIEWYAHGEKKINSKNENITTESQVNEVSVSVDSEPKITPSQKSLLEKVVSEKQNTDVKSEISTLNQEPISKKASKKAAKKEVKELKKLLKENDSADTEMNTLLLVLIAILLPPVAVGLVKGFTSGAFFLNLILWLLFYVPGLIHALIVVLGNSKSS